MTQREMTAAPDRMSAAGAIYDLGYRGYEGPRLGRRAAFATLFWSSLRAAFGMRRGARAKIVPWGLTAIALLPAAIAVGIKALAASSSAPVPSPFTYDNYLWGVQLLFAIFAAAQAPELVGVDQRHHVLSLYFSHAIRRSDYALAKLGSLIAALFIMALLPLLLIFFGSILSASDIIDAVGKELPHLGQIVGSALIYAVPLGVIGLAIAAVTPRRAFATGAIIAVFIVSAAVSVIFEPLNIQPLSSLAQLANPFIDLDGTRTWLFGGSIPESPISSTTISLPLYGLVTIAMALVGTALILWRYRSISA